MGRATVSRIIRPEGVIGFLARYLRIHEEELPKEVVKNFKDMIDVLLGKLHDKMATLKSCRTCGDFHPATTKFFDHDKRNDGGLKHQCKKCRRLYTRRRTRNNSLANCYAGADKEEINRIRALRGMEPLPEGIKHRNGG